METRLVTFVPHGQEKDEWRRLRWGANVESTVSGSLWYVGTWPHEV